MRASAAFRVTEPFDKASKGSVRGSMDTGKGGGGQAETVSSAGSGADDFARKGWRRALIAPV